MKSMQEQPSVKKNFLYSIIYQILNVLTPFITAPYVSRVLGAEGIGIQSYTASVQQYFLMFAVLGTLSYGAREISMNRHDPYKRSKLFWEIELMVITTTTVALLGWFWLIFFTTKYRIYYMVLTIGIIASVFDISWFFNGMEQFKITVIRNSIFKILGILCLFIFIKSNKDLLLYIFIVAVSNLISNFSLWPYMKRYLIKVNPKKLELKKHFKETLIYFVPTIATSVYTVLDKTLLGLITSDVTQNGYYQQAEKIINLAKSIVFTSINAVVGVRNSYLFAEKQFDEIHQRIKTSFEFIFFMGFGCCFGIMGVAKSFVPMFFGPGYDPVVGLLYIFCPIIVIIGISNCLGSQYYTPCGKRKQSANYLIVGAVVNLYLNLLFISRFGAYGAAVASVIAETVITVLYVKFSDGYGNIKLLIDTGAKKLIAGIGMFVVVYLMNNIQVNSLVLVVAQVMVGAVVYGLLLVLLRDKWTCEIIKTVVRKGEK
ncbi:MAG: flippase [Lachnospiraceae bacterium]|nr:flippase [Lachnospiraceae bacterium]